MRASEIIVGLGKDFVKEFTITEEPLYSKYKLVYEHFASSTKKGLLVIGSIGCGKSMMMRVMQRYFKDSDSKFKWVSSSVLKDLIDECTVSEIKSMYGNGLKMDLYIDDIGIYFNTKHYGNCINIITELIFERYELYSLEGFRTHFSSNIPTKSIDKNITTIESLYGSRVYDRMIEMCELISWNSQSLRK